MIVDITDYGMKDGKNFVEYSVSGLSEDQLNYLKTNLDDELYVEGDVLVLTMYFNDEIYPFHTEISKIRLDDFIAREEIEMNAFLSSFLEDMQ